MSPTSYQTAPPRDDNKLVMPFYYRKYKSLATSYSHREYSQLPSALKSLTSVFGMGTGVTSSLSSPDLCFTAFDERHISLSPSVVGILTYGCTLRYLLLRFLELLAPQNPFCMKVLKENIVPSKLDNVLH